MSLQKPAEWFASFFFRSCREPVLPKRVASASGDENRDMPSSSKSTRTRRSWEHGTSRMPFRSTLPGKRPNEGRSLAEEARQMSIVALQERQFRRKGLAVSGFHPAGRLSQNPPHRIVFKALKRLACHITQRQGVLTLTVGEAS